MEQYAKIAEYNIKVNSPVELFGFSSVKSFETADFESNISQSDIDEFKECSNKYFAKNISKFSAVNFVFFKQFAEQIALKGAVLSHGVLADIDGEGILFTAPSGTGKTTHAFNWVKYLNKVEDIDIVDFSKNIEKIPGLNYYKRMDWNIASVDKKSAHMPKMTVVNGDKPIIRFFEGRLNSPLAYGTPLCGKEGIATNMSTPLKHICFITRNEANSVKKIEKSEALDEIMCQIFMPKNPLAMKSTLQLVDRILSSCKLWRINCNMDIESAKIAYNEIFGVIK